MRPDRTSPQEAAPGSWWVAARGCRQGDRSHRAHDALHRGAGLGHPPRSAPPASRAAARAGRGGASLGDPRLRNRPIATSRRRNGFSHLRRVQVVRLRRHPEDRHRCRAGRAGDDDGRRLRVRGRLRPHHLGAPRRRRGRDRIEVRSRGGRGDGLQPTDRQPVAQLGLSLRALRSVPRPLERLPPLPSPRAARHPAARGARAGRPPRDHGEGTVPGLARDRGAVLVPGRRAVEPDAHGAVRARLPRDAGATLEPQELGPGSGLRQPCLRFLDPAPTQLAAPAIRGRPLVHGPPGEPRDPRHRVRLEPDRCRRSPGWWAWIWGCTNSVGSALPAVTSSRGR